MTHLKVYQVNGGNLQWTHKLEFCMVSNNGRQKIRQKICQKISVIKTKSFDWELLTFDNNKKIVHFGISIHVLS